MDYITIYAVISNIDDDVQIHGPFFGGVFAGHNDAKQKAKELANTKTKDVILPWVFSLEGNIAHIMQQARETWFHTFRTRALDSAQILQRDYETGSCPFQDVNVEEVIDFYSAV